MEHESDLHWDYRDGTLTCRLLGEIDHHSAKGVRERADLLLQKYKPSRLILDLSEVSFMDSAGIGLILGRMNTARASGGTLALAGVPPRTMKILSLAGIDRMPYVTFIASTGGKCI